MVTLMGSVAPVHATLFEKPGAVSETTTQVRQDSAHILSQAYQLSGLKETTQNLAARYLNEALSQKAADWVGQAITSVIAEHKGPSFREKLNDPKLRAEMKMRVAARIREEMPKLAKKVVYERLMQGALSETDPVAQKMVGHMVDAMTTPLNTQIDQWADTAYNTAIGQVDRYLKTSVSLGRGNTLNLDATDLRGTIDRAVRLETITDAIATPMAHALGESTFTNMQERLSTFLDDELPPEIAHAIRAGPEQVDAWIAQGKGYLPSEQMSRLKDKVLSMPVITIPNEVYGPTLAGSAARHFALAFADFPIVNAYELNRGREVTQVMIWQLRNKTGITLNVGQLLDLSQWALGQVGGLGQFGRSVAEMRGQINEIESQLKGIEGQLTGAVDQYNALLKEKVAQLEASLKKYQEMAAAPVRDGIAWANESLGGARDWLTDQLPENMNGIPSTWGDFKRTAGIPDKVLGDFGDKSPMDITGVAEKLKTWNAALADQMANVLVDKAHALLPQPEIAPEEENPAQNPSESEDYDPVVLHNGEFVHPVVDVMIPGRGLNFEFKRIYRSRSHFIGRLGWNWTSNLDESLQTWVAPSGPGITWVDADGRKFFFAARTDQLGAFVSPAGVFVQLRTIWNDGEKFFEIKTPEGQVTRFDHRGLLLSTCDRYDNCLRYERDASGLLSSVLDTVGRRVVFSYDHVGRLQKMTDSASREWRYDYDANGDLVHAVSPNNIVTAYYYSSGQPDESLNHNMTATRDPRGNLYLRNIYGKSGFAHDQVVAQSYGGGNHVVKSRWVMLRPLWVARQMPDSMNVAVSRVDLRDRRGIVKRYWHNAAGNVLKNDLIDSAGRVHLGMRYRYDDNSLRVAEILPSGVRIQKQYHNAQIALYQVNDRKTIVQYEDRWNAPMRMTTPDGLVTEWHYDARGSLCLMRRFPENDPAHVIQSHFQSNHYGQRDQMKDAVGAVTSYTYAGANLVAMVRDATGLREATQYRYDAIGNIIEMILPNGGVRKFDVDAQNQIYRETTPMGYVYRYAYDANGNMIAMHVGDTKYQFEYDILDRLVMKDDAVSKTRYAYDVNSHLIEVVWPEGNATRYIYDAMGRVTQMIKGKPGRVRTQYQYDVDGNIVGIGDGTGNLTIVHRNAYGEVTSVKNPNGLLQEWDRNTWGVVVAERSSGRDGLRLAETRFSQDALRLQKTTSRWDSDHQKWLTTVDRFDALGRLIRQQSPSGAIVQRSYDGIGNLLRLELPEGVGYRWEYSALGLPKREVAPGGGVTQFEYDLQGRLVSQRLPNLALTTYSYNAHDNITEIHPPEGAVIRYSYDAAGRRTVVDAEGRVTRYDWDGNGRLRRLVDHEGAETLYGYDNEDRLQQMQYPDGGVESYQYDRNDYEVGRCLDAHCIASQVDVMGNVTQRRAGDVQQRMIYDPLGRMVDAEQGDSKITIQYNTLSQVNRVNQNQFDVVMRYNDDGFRQSLSYSDSQSIEWQRDALGRVTKINSGPVQVPQVWDSYGPSRVQLGKQVDGYQYDAMGNVVSQMVAGNVSHYHYNALGDVTSQNNIQYTYDPWEQLRTAGHQIFEYHKKPEPTYDRRGNLMQDGQLIYHYDALDRLSAVDNASGIPIARYFYDALNRRIAKEIYKKNGGWTHIDYRYDGWELVDIVEANQQIQYVSEDRLDGIVAMRVTINGLEQGYYLHRDRLGNVISVSDAAGKIVERYAYDPFGQPQTISKMGNVRMFTGQVYDAETGLYYMRNRYYSPRLRQFLTRDPIGYKALLYSPSSVPMPVGFSFHRSLGATTHASLPNQMGGMLLDTSLYVSNLLAQNGVGVETNLYTYVGNNPLNETDPLGLYYMRLNRDRGLMYLYSQTGNYIDGWDVGTRGSHDNRLKRLGDTPNGIYKVTSATGGLDYRHPKITMTVNGKRRVIGPESYGLGYLGLQPIAIEPGAKGRSGLAIHGGGSGLKNALENTHQKLVSTYGCVRMHNDDIIHLVDHVHQLEAQGDDQGTLLVYSESMSATADPFNERVRSDYRYLPGAVGGNAYVLH